MQRTAGALLLIHDALETEPEASRPDLNALYSALESRLMKAGRGCRGAAERR
jgi:type VI secretion system protein VasJ